MQFSKAVLKGALSLAAVVALGASTVLAANIAVVGGKTDDEFWSRIKKGVDDARLVVEKNGARSATFSFKPMTILVRTPPSSSAPR